MKKLFVVLCASCCVFASAHAQTSSTATTASTAASQPKDISGVVEFKDPDHDFGKIPYGKPVEYTVEMKNISNDSVKITNVQVSCGCTTPKWKAGPYAAGQPFNITLGFNGYTEGHFEKYVTIFFEGGMNKQVKFHGETFKAPASAAPANGAVEKLKPAQQ